MNYFTLGIIVIIVFAGYGLLRSSTSFHKGSDYYYQHHN